jgi:hypothetical protein
MFSVDISAPAKDLDPVSVAADAEKQNKFSVLASPSSTLHFMASHKSS